MTLERKKATLTITLSISNNPLITAQTHQPRIRMLRRLRLILPLRRVLRMSNPRLLPAPRHRTRRPRPPIHIPMIPQNIRFHNERFPAFPPLLRVTDMCPQKNIPTIVTNPISRHLGVKPTSATLVARVDVPHTRAPGDSTTSVSSPQAETVAFAQYRSFGGNAPDDLSSCVVAPAPDTGIAYVEGLGGEWGVRGRISGWSTGRVSMLARFHPDHVHGPVGAGETLLGNWDAGGVAVVVAVGSEPPSEIICCSDLSVSWWSDPRSSSLV